MINSDNTDNNDNTDNTDNNDSNNIIDISNNVNTIEYSNILDRSITTNPIHLEIVNDLEPINHLVDSDDSDDSDNSNIIESINKNIYCSEQYSSDEYNSEEYNSDTEKYNDFRTYLYENKVQFRKKYNEKKEVSQNLLDKTISNPYSLHEPKHLTDIKSILPHTFKINNILSKDWVTVIMFIFLAYHIFIYVYIGIQKKGAALYTGVMFSTMYMGAFMAYVIIYRQNNPSLTWSNLLSNELILREKFEFNLKKNKSLRTIRKNIKQIINFTNYDSEQKQLKSEINFNPMNYDENTEPMKNYLTQFQFMNENMQYLYCYDKGNLNFYIYCRKWEVTAFGFYLLWNSVALYKIIRKLLPDHIIEEEDSFDNEPEALWGYYNLIGQFFASLGIINVSVIMFSGFYQLKCMILSFAEKLRTLRNRDLPLIKYNIDHLEATEKKQIEEADIFYYYRSNRKEYLFLQKCSITLSDLWSLPVLLIIIFCTQVIISNLYVINYQLTKCGVTNKHSDKHDYCDFFIGFSFIWMFSALGYLGFLLKSISAVNTAATKIKDAFVYADNGLTDLPGETQLVKSEYHAIGGRQNWINYLNTNPLDFSVFGITITTKFVVNSSYAIISTLATFLFSYVFTDNDEEEQ